MSHSANAKVIVLNGPPGVGKSTVARELARGARNSVCIEGDALKRFVVRRSDENITKGLAYQGGAQLTSMYLQAGFDLVIFEFVFERSEAIWRYLDAYTGQAPVHVFCLWAPLEVITARELARSQDDAAGREALGDRVRDSWAKLATGRGLGERVDATAPAEDVVREVRRRAAADGGLMLAPRWSAPSSAARK